MTGIALLRQVRYIHTWTTYDHDWDPTEPTKVRRPRGPKPVWVRVDEVGHFPLPPLSGEIRKWDPETESWVRRVVHPVAIRGRIVAVDREWVADPFEPKAVRGGDWVTVRGSDAAVTPASWTTSVDKLVDAIEADWARRRGAVAKADAEREARDQIEEALRSVVFGEDGPPAHTDPSITVRLSPAQAENLTALIEAARLYPAVA